MEPITINLSEVFKTIQENLVAMRGIDFLQLLKEEKEEMRRELLEVKELVLSIKKKMNEHLGLRTADRGRNPNMSTSIAWTSGTVFN